MKKLIFFPKWLVLFSIILLASFLRLYHLDSNPPSPYWEEVALGYDAYSIANTGKDFHGTSYPVLAFPSYGDYKPSGYFYALVPFVKILGLNVLTVRLPSALAGIISVVLIYLIGKELFSEKTGMIASLLLAISPWAIQFSRGGWEVNLAVMLTLVGTHCLLTARKRPWMLPFAVIFFGLSMYTYHAARLFAPLIGGIGGLGLMWLWFKKVSQTGKSGRYLIVVLFSVLIGFVLVLPFVANLNSQEISSRFTQTTILLDLEPVLKSNDQIHKHGNTLSARFFYHRYWYYGQAILQGFLRHFSPEFLFVRGDGNLRHWNGRYGLLYPLDSIFITVALVLLVAHKQKNLQRNRLAISALLIWILLAAIPPALVKPTPHALRFLFAVPSFCLLAAVGIMASVKIVPKKGVRLFALAIILAYAYLFISFFHWNNNIYPVRAAKDWQYGYREVIMALAREKLSGEKIYITRDEGRPSMFYLFFSRYDPAKIQIDGPSLPKDQLELLRVDDYHFVDTLSSSPGLYATPENKVDPKAHILDTIRRPDGSVVWVVWRR